MIKAKKKIAEENIQKAVKVATEAADAASSEGKAFCVAQVDVGTDTAAIREAVVKVMEQKVIIKILVLGKGYRMFDIFRDGHRPSGYLGYW